MYTGYFGLSEIPFSIAPNPKFLFMSDRHREALAHLTYGLGDTGGFVLLTGEVGTGKTTISRCLMEQLPENTQVAFILNPTLSSQELLATVCDELKIRYRKTGATLKTLTDKIQEKLLKNHENDINTLLIIDEAQHLQPEVLEQLRLLTNLETNTKKLLQVVLIGQPELKQLLQRRDLRQLAQRITARYYLLPLNKMEVGQYIKYRLSVANCHRALFNDRAVSAIHKVSTGIPRLINLLCERSLVNAYSANNSVVNKNVVLQAAEDALGDEYIFTPWWKLRAVQLSFSAVILSAVMMIGIWWGQQQLAIPLVENAVKVPVVEESNNEDSNNEIDGKVKVSLALESSSINNVKETEHPEIMSADVVVVNKDKNENIPLTLKYDPVPTKNTANNDVTSNEDTDYVINSIEGVSEDLLARFQSAIDETNNNSTDTNSNEGSKPNGEFPTLANMPVKLQNSIPKLQFDMHIYASDGNGWVRVNGRDRYEGDQIAEGLILDEILPQKVVLSFYGEYFTLPALSSW